MTTPEPVSPTLKKAFDDLGPDFAEGFMAQLLGGAVSTTELSARLNSRGYAISARALRDERAKHAAGAPARRQPAPSADVAREVSISRGTAEVQVPSAEVADTNTGTALKFLEDEGQNPDEWEVTGFRKITYGQGLESVRFTYKRIAQLMQGGISKEKIDTWFSVLLDPVQHIPANRARGTYVILIADPQFGKKGTEQAIANYKRGVLAHLERAAALGCSSIHIAWQGDETENVVNSYGNQPHTIELNRSQQLELDFDMRVWAIKEAMRLGLPISCSSVISNHGEWTRNGGKDPVTTRNDNASTYVAHQVRKLFEELEPYTGVKVAWTIGTEAPGVTVTLSGVKCYFSHGYVEKGRGGSTEIRTKSAIERQILGRKELTDVSIWFMAHYHHFYTNEFEGRTLFGCPAIEAEKSSEYMLDQFGVWSPPGVLGLLVTDQVGRGWSDVNVF